MQPIISEAPFPKRVQTGPLRSDREGNQSYGLVYTINDSYVRVGATNVDNSAPLGSRYKPSGEPQQFPPPPPQFFGDRVIRLYRLLELFPLFQ